MMVLEPTNSGHVRIYDWNGSSWAQVGSDINGEAAGDESGYSVSLNKTGNLVAIGAPKNDGTGSDGGQVRVYSYNGSSWSKLGQDIDGETAYDYFGSSVALNDDGDRLIVGATNNSANGQVQVTLEFLIGILLQIRGYKQVMI